MRMDNKEYMNEAVKEAYDGIKNGHGGPFGTVIVKNGKIVGRGHNRVLLKHDPTCHGEVEAIRDACANLGTHSLDGCVLYTTAEPCPMCLGAIYWAHIDRIFYGNNRKDAAGIGFADDFIYEELDRPMASRTVPIEPLLRDEALSSFRLWQEKDDKTEY